MGGRRQEVERFARALDGGGAVEVTACMHHRVAPGFAVVARTFDQHVCNLVLERELQVEVEGRRRVLGPGGALWIGPGVAHDFRLPRGGRPFAMLNLRFRLTLDGAPVGLPERCLLVDDARDLRCLWELAVDDARRVRVERGRRFLHLLALLHGDLAARDGDEASERGLGRARRLALAAWVARNLHRRPTPAELAAVVGLSPDWFRRAFAASYGCSPRAWLVRERMRRAAQRLADDPALPIARLAEELGFADHRLLDRQFRRVHGASPRGWRAS